MIYYYFFYFAVLQFIVLFSLCSQKLSFEFLYLLLFCFRLFTYSTPSVENESFSNNNINNENKPTSDKSANNDNINHNKDVVRDEEGGGNEDSNRIISSAIHSSLSNKHVIINTDHYDLNHKDSPEPVSDSNHNIEKETAGPERDKNDDSLEGAESVASVLVHFVDGHKGIMIHQKV